MATIKGSNLTGTVMAVCISKEKGTKKALVGEVFLKEGFGIVNDAHAGSSRQISLLAEESIEKMRAAGLDVGFGDFGENISTEGIDLKNLPIAARIKIGEDIVLEITQIGKKCVSRCDIYNKTGACIMPKEGVFAKVLKGGALKAGSKIEVLNR